MSKQRELCSIIILSFNQVTYTKQCLESIRKYTDYPYEIIMIDNASDQETITYLEEQEDIVLIKNKINKGFAGGCNQGMELAKGNYLLLINNDTIVTKNWLSNMVKLMESDPEIAMVGPLTNSTVGKQMIAVPYGEDMVEMQRFAEILSSDNHKPWRTLRLVAFCLLIHRSLIEEMGMFDETFQVGNYEDDDFNLRAVIAGKKSYICRNSFIHHFMNISFNKNNLPREQIMCKNKLILEKKWDYMNWNHHAAFNTWLLQEVLDHRGMNILHIGCGLGTLAIELKDRNYEYYITGVEDHPIRKKIAKNFVDALYEWDDKLTFIDQIENKYFDTLIIECMLEKSGIKLLEKIKPLLNVDTQILLRVFNVRHITTIERIISGEVEGNLLCASSDEFLYYFDKDLKIMLEELGYQVIEEMEVKKSLSIRQEKLMKKFEDDSCYSEDGRIYNRIYSLKLLNK